MNIKAFAILLLLTLAFSSTSFAGSKEEKIEWSQVPPQVQKTITEHAQDGEILEIEKETENKAIIYEAEIKKPDGKEIEIKVDESGKLIEIEEEIEWSQVPPQVQKTITEHAQGGEILEIEKETENKAIIYEAEIKKPDGKKIEIKVDENGKLIEIEDKENEDD